MSVYEIYVEKRAEFAIEASQLLLELQVDNLTNVRIINRYFAEDINQEHFEAAKNTIFSDPPVDIIYDKLPSFLDARILALEYLPGQFDQRANSSELCFSFLTGKEKPVIQTAKIYVFYGDISDHDFSRIKSLLINPVEMRETKLEKPLSIVPKFAAPIDVAIIDGFNGYSDLDLKNLQVTMNLAMDLSDLQFCQVYFRDEEKRNPTITELKLLDTYWSDHCRHTTFLTELTEVKIDDEQLQKSFNNYLALKKSLGLEKSAVTLMEMATIGAKALKKRGLLADLDESEEINACTVKIKVDVDGIDQDWLLMFKNETHNHPTEIEPFGGAATCLGGAIRDPLSARAYVYQAMRITGAGNPLENINDTMPGKLPQRKICRVSADGYSSYGNQIGVTTGLVQEIYHPGFKAKRMELGAVIGAAPCENVVRKTPLPGDVVILLGGKTGRDGIGGATGSSKEHTSTSLETCGADVQKGNAPEERKIQRLFRKPDAVRLIKRCDDFGAGGVSVSAGELADGLVINLDKVPTKYEGLNGTELAISESQERMSIVVSKYDAAAFIDFANSENLEATIIGEVTEEPRLIMNWNKKTIVNLSRKFLNSNGAKKYAKAHLTINDKLYTNTDDLEKFIGSLNICSQKGLVERFDSSVGASTIIAPFGGKYKRTPAQLMAAKIPVLNGETKTCSLMSWGYDPEISSQSPFHGAVFSVVHSIAKIIASGGSRSKCYLSFQEYFEKLHNDPKRWGKPVSALLGALDAQLGLEVAAIGGKDSMSGSFTLPNGNTIDVPPTLVSFAVSTTKIDNIITPEFKNIGSSVYHLKSPFDVFEKPDYEKLRGYFNFIENLITQGNVLSAWAVGSGGTAEAIIKMCMGNRIGLAINGELSSKNGFGGFVIEMNNEQLSMNNEQIEIEIELLGCTTSEYTFDKLQDVWEKTLEPVYPYLIKQDGKTENFKYSSSKNNASQSLRQKIKKPQFLIPVFFGTNSEYDTIKAIEKSAGEAKTIIIRNLTPVCLKESIQSFKEQIESSQAIVIPGGSSCGDEPDGCAKLITTFMRNPIIADIIMEFLQKRDGLICGIGNGFQALVKLGLLPYGEIRVLTKTSPTLTFNTIGVHQSTLVNTKVVSNLSPWLSHLELFSQYIVPFSGKEGRFTAEESIIRLLAANGQIATQYVDFNGNASQDIRFNPGNSDFSIEGITSPDGRIFGCMTHPERFQDGLYRNIPGIKKMDIFSGAVKYFL
ncbi:MAG: phosphoribosylformylglycinamidine synthase [Treponema sp.]|jgi:phosphoribosylformylglycinamidine synthase|nr:phosphoribosylformylglycinamidine synthase [Treponema sp.]